MILPRRLEKRDNTYTGFVVIPVLLVVIFMLIVLRLRRQRRLTAQVDALPNPRTRFPISFSPLDPPPVHRPHQEVDEALPVYTKHPEEPPPVYVPPYKEQATVGVAEVGMRHGSLPGEDIPMGVLARDGGSLGRDSQGGGSLSQDRDSLGGGSLNQDRDSRWG